MRIGVLTSSRADFGIYMPLLKQLQADPDIEFEIIAFGTHLSYCHGFTLNDILEQGFDVNYKIETIVLGDSQESIASSIGLTVLKFSSFWGVYSNDFDLVFCLGDRYEMFAAVSAGIPFNIRFAHIHAGETTLGAIDNIFRHSISHASTIHFTSTEGYAERLRKMIDKPIHVHNVGALSLDNIKNLTLLSKEEFSEKWGIELRRPNILVTLHPETASSDDNRSNTMILCSVIKDLPKYNFIITMPNADTEGNCIREVFENELRNEVNVYLVESFGTKGYFTAMQYCSLLLGNTSSGIIEAASFNKYVINLGVRQAGRLINNNTFQVEFCREEILSTISKVEKLPPYMGTNIYWNGGAANKIISAIKN